MPAQYSPLWLGGLAFATAIIIPWESVVVPLVIIPVMLGLAYLLGRITE